MPIVYITGAAASGKTTALEAIARSLEAHRRPVIYAQGNSTIQGIAMELRGHEGAVVLVDDCQPKLLEQLEAPGALPDDCRVFVTLAAQLGMDRRVLLDVIPGDDAVDLLKPRDYQLATIKEAQGAQTVDERAAFEGLAKAQGLSVTRTTQGLAFANGTRRDAGDYIDLLSLVSWHFWQARAALATHPAVRGAEHDQ